MYKTAFRIFALTGLLVSMAWARVTTPSPIPEPGSLLLLGTGIAAIALLARNRMKK